MKRSKLFITVAAIIGSLIITTSCCSKKTGDGLYKGYETSKYQLKDKFENIEIRQYNKKLLAQVEVYGTREKAAKEGFMILAKYIFGKNTKDLKIAMTSPVTQVKLAENKWIVQFSMPEAFNIKTLPQPKDNKISFKPIEKKKYVAIIFSGSWSDSKFNENTQKLKEYINSHKLKTKGQPILAYYDDPFTLPWNRRNEVMWEIK